MNTPYEILIRGDADGSFSGAHVIDAPGSPPRPILVTDWPAIAKGVNAASLAKIAEIEKTLKDLASSHAKQVQEIERAISTTEAEHKNSITELDEKHASEVKKLTSEHDAAILVLNQSHAVALSEKLETIAAKNAEVIEANNIAETWKALANATEKALAEKNALIDSAKNDIKSAIADKKLDAEATVSAIAGIVTIVEMPEIEKRKAALAAEIASKQAELESL